MKAERIRRLFDAFLSEQDGVTAIEYALLAALIFVVILASVKLMSDSAGALFETVAAIFPLAG